MIYKNIKKGLTTGGDAVQEDDGEYGEYVQPPTSLPLLRNHHRRLLQLRRVADARAEPTARDQLAVGAPARDVLDAHRSVDDGCGVEANRERRDEPEAGRVENEAADERRGGIAYRDDRLDDDDVDNPIILARHLDNHSFSVC